MSVLTKAQIVAAMSGEPPGRQMFITPLLNPDQIREASVDLRLGHEFIVFNRSLIDHIDPAASAEITKNIHRYQQRVRVRRREAFVLHPRQFVLGATLEYVVVPPSLQASVSGRSTWGRTGLVIATATTISPGYKGCITLELANEGLVPVVLRPGERIVQVTFAETKGEAEYEGRYGYSTGPSFPKFKDAPDAHFWYGEQERSG